MSKGNGKCKKHHKYKGTPLVEPGSTERLDAITIACTCKGIIFQVRYSNGSLCVCGQLNKANLRQRFSCQEKLSSLDITVNVSTNHIKANKERCDVSFYFDPHTDRIFMQKQILIMLPPSPMPTKKSKPTAREPSLKGSGNNDDLIYIAPAWSSTLWPTTPQFQRKSSPLKSTALRSTALQRSVYIGFRAGLEFSNSVIAFFSSHFTKVDQRIEILVLGGQFRA